MHSAPARGCSVRVRVCGLLGEWVVGVKRIWELASVSNLRRAGHTRLTQPSARGTITANLEGGVVIFFTG